MTPESDALTRLLCRLRALTPADVSPVIAEVRSARAGGGSRRTVRRGVRRDSREPTA